MAARAFAGPEHLLLVIASCRSAMPARAPSWLARAALPGTRRRMSSAPESRGVYTSQTTGKRYMAVVGLEIHAQLNSRSKLFSGGHRDVTHLRFSC